MSVDTHEVSIPRTIEVARRTAAPQTAARRTFPFVTLHRFTSGEGKPCVPLPCKTKRTGAQEEGHTE